MATMSGPQQTKVTTLQTKLAIAKAAITDAVGAAYDVMDDTVAVGTAESALAGGSVLSLAGALQQAKGIINQAHGEVSKAMIAYDSVNGRIIAQGGGGGRKS
jgi:hypothetical protein